MKYIIGCSGFSYPEWKDTFYPPKLAKNKWLHYYSQHFDSVELNVTFYRTMKPEFFQKIYAEVHEDFVFSVKAPRIITHFKRFVNTQEDVHSFYASVDEGLKNKLGCILFQLTPLLHYSGDKLQSILPQLNTDYKNVLEFRHSTWWDPAVYDALRKSGISFCMTSYPGLPDDLIPTSPIVYIRLHGVPQLYKSDYSRKYLQDIASAIKELKNINEVYIYFDNTMSLNAIKNAETMRELIGS